MGVRHVGVRREERLTDELLMIKSLTSDFCVNVVKVTVLHVFMLFIV